MFELLLVGCIRAGCHFGVLGIPNVLCKTMIELGIQGLDTLVKPLEVLI